MPHWGTSDESPNIYFHGNYEKSSLLFCWKDCLIYSYAILELSYFTLHEWIWTAKHTCMSTTNEQSFITIQSLFATGCIHKFYKHLCPNVRRCTMTCARQKLRNDWAFCCLVLFCLHSTISNGLCHPKNVSLGICEQWRPRSACTSVQSDQGLHCPLTESLGTIESMNGEQRHRWNFGHVKNDVNLSTVELQWLKPRWLIHHGWIEHVLESADFTGNLGRFSSFILQMYAVCTH